METREILIELERLIKGIDVIAAETNEIKKQKCVKLFKEIVNNCQCKVDKQGKILGGLLMEQIQG